MEYGKIVDITACYLSEYDMRAFEVLGYETQAEGFEMIASVFGKKPSYLRRLRDEYDVVTTSTRKGQRNRAPRTRVVETQKYLADFSFEDLTEMVKAFIRKAEPIIIEEPQAETDTIENGLRESEIEAILNFKDPGATIRIKLSDNKVRIYNTTIIKQLKKLYGGRCQLCGERPFKSFCTDICEVHHIRYFSESHNNDVSNLIVVCPNHHRLLHKLNPVYEADTGCFKFKNGETLSIILDMHLVR